MGITMTNTIFAVVDAAGEFKKSGRFDTGEFASHHEAESFRASLPNPDDYTVQSFTDDSDCPDCGGIGADHHAGCDSKHLTISQQAKTILADTDEALSVEINLVALTALAARELLNGFDYTNQAWVRNGRYVRCGHPAPMNCDCYGRLHHGETVAPGTEVR